MFFTKIFTSGNPESWYARNTHQSSRVKATLDCFKDGVYQFQRHTDLGPGEQAPLNVYVVSDHGFFTVKVTGEQIV